MGDTMEPRFSRRVEEVLSWPWENLPIVEVGGERRAVYSIVARRHQSTTETWWGPWGLEVTGCKVTSAGVVRPSTRSRLTGDAWQGWALETLEGSGWAFDSVRGLVRAGATR